VHRLNTAWRNPSRVDSNDHPIFVEDIELRTLASTPHMVCCSIAAGWIGVAARLM